MIPGNIEHRFGTITTGPFRQTNAYSDILERENSQEKWALIGPGTLEENPGPGQSPLCSKVPQLSELLSIAESKDVQILDVYDCNPEVIKLCKKILKKRTHSRNQEMQCLKQIFANNTFVDSPSKIKITKVLSIFSEKNCFSEVAVNFFQHKFPDNADQCERKYDMILATFVLENNDSSYEEILPQWISMLKNGGTLYIENKNYQKLSSVIQKIESAYFEIRKLSILIKRSGHHPMAPSSRSDNIIYVSASSSYSQRTGGVTTFPIAAITPCSRQRKVASEKKFANTPADYWFARAKEHRTLSEKAIKGLDKVREKSFECSQKPSFHNFNPLHIAMIMKNKPMIDYLSKHLPDSAWEEKDAFDLTPRDYPIELS